MVKQYQYIIFLFCPLLLSACSPKWWGENAPAAKVVTAPKNENNCPSPDKIVKGSEEESQLALQCLQNDISDAWGKIRGREKNALAPEEIDVLVNKGIVDIGANKDLSKRKIRGIKRLLGVEGKASRAQTDALVGWMASSRKDGRALYQKITNHEYISYADIKSATQILSHFFAQTNWQISREEFGAILADLIDDGSAESAVPEFANVLFDTAGALCPGLAKQKSWQGNTLAVCATSLTNSLEAGAYWFEFIMNQTEKNYDMNRLSDSLDKVVAAVDKWTAQKSLDGLHPRLWVKMAEKLKAQPPSDFTQSLNIITKFHEASSGQFIHPSAVGKFFHVIQYYHHNLFEGMPIFLNAYNNGSCLNHDAKNWKDCEIAISDDLREKNTSMQIAWSAKNTNYGKRAAPFTGHQFKKMMLFHSVSREIITAFDAEKKGFITSDFSQDTDDEVMQLLSVALNSIETIGRFVENFQLRLNNKPILEQPPFSTFANTNMKGMARLVTMAGSDILVRRTPKDRNIFLGLLSNFTNTFPTNSVQLDQSAITAILVLVDSLGAYRDVYTGVSDAPVPAHEGTSNFELLADKIQVKQDARFDQSFVNRAVTMKTLPKILKENFPRTYASCTEFDFERSCGLTFDSILPDADERGMMSAGNLDLITLIASAMESVLDSCDYNGDGRLSWKLLDGDDELDCTFTNFASITKRLMESKLIHVKGERKVSALLDIVNSIFLTRAFAKVALMEGSTKGIIAAPITLWFHKDASLGSIYGLFAELLDSDKVKNYEKNISAKQLN